MFGLGHAPELILVLAIALIVLGPGKIPEVAQFLGKAIRELRQASADLQQTFNVNELVNPTPTPPPAEAPTWQPASSTATTETILPPAEPEVPAKPKRSRKKAAAEKGATPESLANGASMPEPALETAAAEAQSENGAEPAKRPARRRASRKIVEPVSLDVPA